MAKRKLKKLPKKPKAGASVQTMERYLDRVAAIKKENSVINAENQRAVKLRATIASISPASVTPGKSSSGFTRRKKSGSKKKAAKKSGGRKRKR